jgi:hypothetical protein
MTPPIRTIKTLRRLRPVTDRGTGRHRGKPSPERPSPWTPPQAAATAAPRPPPFPRPPDTAPHDAPLPGRRRDEPPPCTPGTAKHQYPRHGSGRPGEQHRRPPPANRARRTHHRPAGAPEGHASHPRLHGGSGPGQRPPRRPRHEPHRRAADDRGRHPAPGRHHLRCVGFVSVRACQSRLSGRTVYLLVVSLWLGACH